MVSDVPVTDFELLTRWEWFRRAGWGEDSARVGLCNGFYTLAAEAGADVCLDADCGFADNGLYLSKLGLCNVVCCDESDFIIDRARENIESRGKNLPLFVSSLERIKENSVHQFDAVFCPSLMLEPQWQNLHAKFCGVFNALRPGGFLAFTGPAQGRDWSVLLEEYRRKPREEAVWSYSEGSISCVKVIVRDHAQENFADERIMHVINEAGVPRVESTSRRLPAYWNWSIVTDLARQSGFCHVEQRSFQNDGQAATRMIVAWKDGTLADKAEHEPPHYSAL